MSTLRKLKAYVLGDTPTDHAAELKAAAIPVSDVDCRGCADPCDEGHDEYPSRFDVDMESDMLGSVKPYARQLIISTGKSDWAKDIADEERSLAAYIEGSKGDGPHHHKGGEKGRGPKGGPGEGSADELPGIHDSNKGKKLTILNGSHNSVSDDPQQNTVLVFPDYTVVTDVTRSAEGAQKFLRSIGSKGAVPKTSDQKTYVLHYAAVVLLCSHKRRDNRCAIAAPKLEAGLTAALEREGWEVHTQVEDPSLSSSPLEELTGADEEKEADVLRLLQSAADSKRVLILHNSHMGGHKFAGNIIINTPQGAAVWYGRVTPHEANAVAKETIIGGKVLPPLLRGGLNLCRPGHSSLRDW